MKNAFIVNTIRSETKLLLDRLRFCLESRREQFNHLSSLFESFSAETVLTIAFIGQYNAGKSTILKALTGNDIKISAEPETNQVTEYDWNGTKVVDTPGIRAGQDYQAHDLLTERQIVESDLLVFVISADGFGQEIADFFRHLAVDEDRGHELILVVNKSDATPGDLETKRDDIEKVTDPLKLEELRCVLISMDDYEDALTTENQVERQNEIEESGFPRFVEALNEFSADNGFSARLRTPLIQIKSASAEVAVKVNSESPEVDAAIELLRRKLYLLDKSKMRLTKKVEAIVDRAVEQAAEHGEKIANFLSPGVKKLEIDQRQAEVEKEFADLASKCADNVEKVINEEIAHLKDEFKDLRGTDIAVELSKLRPVPDGAPRLSGSRPNVTQIATMAERIGSFLVDSSTRGGIGGWIAPAVGSDMHKFVYNVGKIFGHNFRPWEAVGIAANIGRIGHVLSFVGAWLPIVTIPAEVLRDNAEQNKLIKSRNDIRLLYRKSGREVRNEIINQFNKFCSEFYESQRAFIDSDMISLCSSQESNSALIGELNAISHGATQLLEQIRNSVELD